MTLPKAKTPPKSSISDVSILLYGPPKIGKSTFASQAPDAIFLATESGLGALDTYEQKIRSWEEFLAACAELAEGKHEFKTVVLDTADNAYKMCSAFICNKFGVEHESDMSYGKGFSLVNNEFMRVVGKLAFLPYGLILISHSIERDIETRTGKETRIVPTLPDKIRKLISGQVDMILYCDIEVEKNDDGTNRYGRVIRTQPHANYEAGDRFGCLPPMMDLNFNALVAAFAAANKPKTKGA